MSSKATSISKTFERERQEDRRTERKTIEMTQHREKEKDDEVTVAVTQWELVRALSNKYEIIQVHNQLYDATPLVPVGSS